MNSISMDVSGDNTTALANKAIVINQCMLAPTYFRLTVRAPRIASAARPGQFVHILPRRSGPTDPLLRRAFSVACVSGYDLDVIYRVSGRGTQALSRWTMGEEIDILGPLGHAFASLGRFSLLVGGGVGVPPLAFLATQRDTQQNVFALIGARSKTDVLCQEEFSQSATPYEIATDDGSIGHRGLVTELLQRRLETFKGQGIAGGADGIQVFACGPVPMLHAVAKLCANFQVPCQVSLEEAMPCGVGVCNGCVVPVLTTQIQREQQPVNVSGREYARYRRLCVEGPMLWAHEVDWDHFTSLSC